MPPNINPRFIVIGIAGFLFLLFIFAMLSAPSPENGGTAVSGNLTMWGYLPQAVVHSALEGFPSQLQVAYKEFPRDGFEGRVVNALAAGQGPDIFILESSARIKNLSKLAPAPSGFFTLRELQDSFADIVLDDFYLDGQIYGLPATLNPLALFYNKDHFNAAGIPLPPKTWNEFREIAKRLTIKQGNILRRGGAALGTGDNISHFKDVLIAQLLQQKRPNQNLFEGPLVQDVFSFYLAFSDPRASEYSWNTTFLSDLEAFANGGVSMIFAYPSDIKTLVELNPRLNFDVAPLPQLDVQNPVYFSNYSVFVVSNLSNQKEAAWTAIKLFTDSRSSTIFSNGIFEPSSRRDLFSQTPDPKLSVFASMILSLKNWPDPDAETTRSILRNGINDYLTGRKNLSRVVSEARIEILRLSQEK